VVVAPFVDGSSPWLDDSARAALLEWDASARLDLAGDVPAIDWPAAEWATVQFYGACQLLVGRDVPALVVHRVLEHPCPAARGPATDFSVDLIFRFLPELYVRARQLAPADALVTALEAWSDTWTLSSVGIPLKPAAGNPAIDSFAGSAPLWRLYLDRVAARHAADRWRDSRVAAQLRADLGAFPELAPAIASALALSLPSTAAAPSA